MREAKLVVIYPRPTDIEAFEKIYLEEHVPMAVAKLAGKTKIVATKITSSPQGTPPFHRMVEIHFPSKAARRLARLRLVHRKHLRMLPRSRLGERRCF